MKFAALACVLLYLAACLVMFTVQRSLLFPADTRDVALDVALVPRAEVRELRTSDGETLRTWWVAPADESRAVYLYLHGNAENLATRDGRFTLLTAEGAGLLAPSWRGYGGSTGSPSEAGLHLDALAGYDWLRQQGVAPERIIVFGESLGTGVAMQLGSTRAVAALVLDSPYTAIWKVAQQRYPWLPVELLSRDPFDSLQWAAAVKVPVFVFHCTQDVVVPYAMGLELFAALAAGDKQMESIERRCHVPSVQPLLPRFRALERKITGM
jgi:hypothetical protein